MKHIILFIAFFIAASPIVFSQTKKTTPLEKHPVETFFMSGIAAFNAHNLDEFVKQFGDDIEMFMPTGWLRGKSAVRERFISTFKDFPTVKMEIEDLRVRQIRSDLVLVDFKWHTFPKGSGPAFHGVGSGVYVLRDKKWVEILEHETVVKIDEGLGRGSR